MRHNVDTDALKLFKALYETESLSAAAQRCSLSLAAASRLLNKLRDTFEDELFTRYSHGMTPTLHAKELYGPINELISGFSRLFENEIFSPANLTRVFHIGAVDNGVATFLAPVMRNFFDAAPKAGIEFKALNADPFSQLKTGEIDVAIYPTMEVRVGYHTQRICQDTMVLIVREGHPLAHRLQEKGAVNAADIRAYRQIRITLSPRALIQNDEWTGVTEQVPIKSDDCAVWTPYFLSAPFMINNTDFVLALPLHLSKHITQHCPGLVILGRPESAVIFEPVLLWHDQSHRDPAAQWLRAMILAQSRSLTDPHTVPIIKDL